MESVMSKKIVDLFIIGGGINGAGIARDATGRGLSVMMCEKDDLAEGTSSRSGKLVWRVTLSRVLRVSAGARGAD
jgi:glycerol-3-phosphate dehydrogenase